MKTEAHKLSAMPKSLIEMKHYCVKERKVSLGWSDAGFLSPYKTLPSSSNEGKKRKRLKSNLK